MIKRSTSFEQILSKGIWRFWRWPLGQNNIPKPHIDPSFRSWTFLRLEFTFIVGVGIYPPWKRHGYLLHLHCEREAKKLLRIYAYYE